MILKCVEGMAISNRNLLYAWDVSEQYLGEKAKKNKL